MMLEILVVEDKEIHQNSAEELRAQGHSVTIVGTLNDALKQLDENGERQYLGAPASKYDVLLTDVHFPAGRLAVLGRPEGDEAQTYSSTPAPLGDRLVWYAASRGVPLIAELTDSNHHQGPIAATFDLFKTYDCSAPAKPLRVNDSKVLLFDSDMLKTYGGPKNWVKALEYLQQA